MAARRDDSAQAIREIEAAIERFGVEVGPAFVRAQGRWAGVSRATWFRWQKSARASHKAQAAAYTRRIVETIPADVLPVMPSPAVVARSPMAARRNLDFLAKMQELYADAEMLRTFSIAKNADDSEKVKNPMFFGNSIKLRGDLLERWLQALGLLFDIEQIRNFYSTIVEEVEKESPECAARIMIRLDELNRRRGFTMSGQI